jgi:hypothetical protein
MRGVHSAALVALSLAAFGASDFAHSDEANPAVRPAAAGRAAPPAAAVGPSRDAERARLRERRAYRAGLRDAQLLWSASSLRPARYGPTSYRADEAPYAPPGRPRGRGAWGWGYGRDSDGRRWQASALPLRRYGGYSYSHVFAPRPGYGSWYGPPDRGWR